MALRAGDDGVAGIDRGAGDEADPVGAAHRDHVADREHDLAGRLREGCSRERHEGDEQERLRCGA